MLAKFILKQKLINFLYLRNLCRANREYILIRDVNQLLPFFSQRREIYIYESINECVENYLFMSNDKKALGNCSFIIVYFTYVALVDKLGEHTRNV